jgi:protein O-GlcNAc transferase
MSKRSPFRSGQRPGNLSPPRAAELTLAFQRAVAFHQAGRLPEAEQIYRQILKAEPRHFDSQFMLGVIYSQRGHHAEALRHIDLALKINPKSAAAHNSRGVALGKLKRPVEALASFDRAIALTPDHAEAHSNRGNALRELGRLEEALSSCDRAVALKPDHAEAFNNRGNVLIGLKRQADAIASFERALEINPDFAYARGLRLLTKMQLCDWRSYAADIAQVTEGVRAGKRVSTPWAVLGQCDGPDDQLLCAQIWVRDKYPATPPIYRGERYRHEKIRVAYLSADFRRHPTADLTARLFELHDRARFEIFGISFGPDDRSEMRARLAGSFDRFHDVAARDDREIAGLMRRLEVDIAVDLMGHTFDSRLGILAARPAPIQVAYLGYPGTTGAPFIDYLIADPVVLPFERQKFCAEKIVHLPDSYQVNDSTKVIAPITPSRAQAGLPADGVVFCSFNQNFKITPPVFDIWMRLVGQVEGSVLWLLSGEDGANANLCNAAQARGVDAARLKFAPRLELAEHLARLRLADLFLDTSPVNAHTGASDALWAGVPVLTCAGNAFAGRVGASLLMALGLPELITDSLADYEALALALARDPPRLAAARRKLADRRTTYPLFDTDRSRRHLEAAYSTMWNIHRRGESPRSFNVEPIA